MEGLNKSQEVKVTSTVELIKRDNSGEGLINLGDAYFSSPVGEIIVTKDGDDYDTHSKGIAHIPGIGDIEISLYYAKDYLSRILAAHGKLEISIGKNQMTDKYYDPKKKCFIEVESSESEIKP